MLCCRCKKRQAMFFIATNTSTNPQPYCAVCAKELGFPQVNEMMEKLGLDDKMLEEASEQFENLMSGDGGELASLFEMGDNEAEAEEDPNFEMGGAPVFPKNLKAFFDRMTPGGNDKNSAPSGEEKKAPPANEKKNKFKYLRAYCDHLTGKARDGMLDRIIGREKEIGRVVQILSRRTKNNPCLIGEPGVGKTAIAEGLALRIVQG